MAWLLHVARNRFNQALRHLRVVEKHLDEATRDAAGKPNTASDNSPEEQVANRELIDLVFSRLTSEERVIAEYYGRGESWETIAQALGGRAEALRKRSFGRYGGLPRNWGSDGVSDVRVRCDGVLFDLWLG